jgi:hypothetical protein
MLELDLIGHTVRLSESDTRWIYHEAKRASGHSLGARDLATRLQGLDSAPGRRKLVLSRAESSALARLLAAGDGTSGECLELRASLSELLAPT